MCGRVVVSENVNLKYSHKAKKDKFDQKQAIQFDKIILNTTPHR